MELSVQRGLVVLAVGAAAFSVAANQSAQLAATTDPPAVRAEKAPKFPDVPYRYAELALPPYFTQGAAQRFDNTPSNNPITNEGAALGRVLFYDTRLSVNGAVSCGSCHVQSHGFADPNRFSRGFDGRFTDRHAMNLVNLRFHPRGRFFWDERGPSLEQMVLMPVRNHLEMGQDPSKLPAILGREVWYQDLFRRAFPDETITQTRISFALAQFLRSMVSYRSKYDEGRMAVRGVSEDFPNYAVQENRGKALFLRNCAVCHLPDQEAHFIMVAPANTGLDEDTEHADGGVGDITLNPRELGQFKSPGLRNVEVTGPYMHDGRFATLEAVLDHYSSGGKAHPNRDIRVQPLNFTKSEQAALIAFLKTLTDQKFLTDPKFSDPFQ